MESIRTKVRIDIEFQTLVSTSKVRNCPCQAISVTANSCDRHMSMTLWRKKAEKKHSYPTSAYLLHALLWLTSWPPISQSDVPANICSLLDIYLSVKDAEHPENNTSTRIFTPTVLSLPDTDLCWMKASALQVSENLWQPFLNKD